MAAAIRLREDFDGPSHGVPQRLVQRRKRMLLGRGSARYRAGHGIWLRFAHRRRAFCRLLQSIRLQRRLPRWSPTIKGTQEPRVKLLMSIWASRVIRDAFEKIGLM